MERMGGGSDEFRIASSGIDHEGRLPRKYTDEGQGAKRNISPPLEWHNLPQGTKSLVLIVEAPDPDAPMPWTCWVVVNIPPSLKGGLPEGFSGQVALTGDDDPAAAGMKEGHNDFKVPGWLVPKMPTRLEFKLYALDHDHLHYGNKVTKEKVLEAIEGHVIGEAVLIANF